MRLARGGWAAVVGLALCGAACRPTPRDAARRSGSDTTGSSGGAAAAPDPTGPFVRFEAAGVPAYTLERERGVGIVHLDPGPSLAGRAADTLDVRVRPDPRAGVLARLVLDSSGVYTFEAREGAVQTPGALEFGYEEVGLPILAHGTDGWERVYLGTSAGGTVVDGWARRRPSYVSVTLWDEMLPGLPLFFALPPDSIRFYAAPDSAQVGFPVNPDDYILWPLEPRGDWMRVRVATPSDYCAAPPPPGTPGAAVAAPRQDTLWIRWRGESGRPRVWFFTRGC